MKIAIASDHAGFRYKELVKEHLALKGVEVIDFGTDSEKVCDYPDFVIPAAKSLRDQRVDRAIVLGGSGNGEAMAANRLSGVRCCVCLTVQLAKLARMHNDCNALALGQRIVPEDQLLEIIDAWLETPFNGGRHIARLTKIESIRSGSVA